jgi:excisionase family DNA binding protein
MPKPRQDDAKYDVKVLLLKSRLRSSEAAFLLDVSERSIDRYMNEGKLEFTKTPGGRRRVLVDSLRRYL